jgi:hypothetical protein
MEFLKLLINFNYFNVSMNKNITFNTLKKAITFLNESDKYQKEINFRLNCQFGRFCQIRQNYHDLLKITMNHTHNF